MRPMKYRNLFKWLLLSVTIFSALVLRSLADRGVPASEGITNFGKISAVLYRGAQPDENGIEHLKALGVKMIINLRVPRAALKAEAAEAASNGITYTNIPLAGVGRPSDADVLKILNLIETSPGPVFIHCEHGCDRTGTIIACYRIHHDHWTAADAMREAEKYGLSRYERGMRHCIAGFADLENRKAQASALPPNPNPF
jgi:tyrosine-protein phosphatase SIW14